MTLRNDDSLLGEARQYVEGGEMGWSLVKQLAATVERLQQYHDWAEPQITQHGKDQAEIERLRAALTTAWDKFNELKSDAGDGQDFVFDVMGSVPPNAPRYVPDAEDREPTEDDYRAAISGTEDGSFTVEKCGHPLTCICNVEEEEEPKVPGCHGYSGEESSQ